MFVFRYMTAPGQNVLIDSSMFEKTHKLFQNPFARLISLLCSKIYVAKSDKNVSYSTEEIKTGGRILQTRPSAVPKEEGTECLRTARKSSFRPI